MIRHALRWRGGGDSITSQPPQAVPGLAFAIETKTRSYHAGDLSRIAAIAVSLERHGRFGARRRLTIPILCLAGARGVERREGQVVVRVRRPAAPCPEAVGRHDASTRVSAVTSAGARVFRVRADALAELHRRIAALDRRAGRLGTGPIQLREIGRPRGGYVHVRARRRAAGP